MLKALRRFRHESKLKTSVMLTATLCFWCGLFYFFQNTLRFLGNFPDIKASLVEIVLALFLFSLSVMLLFSNAIIGFAVMFRSEESAFLLRHPIAHEQIYLSKFMETLTFSSWALFMVAFPLLLALGLDWRAPLFFYPYAVCLLAVFVVIPGGIGAMLGMLLPAWFPGRAGKIFALSALLVIGTGLLIMLNRMSLNLFDLGVTAAWMMGILGKISFCQNPLLPSFWVASLFVHAIHGWTDKSLLYLLLLLSNAMFFSMLPYQLSKKFYYRAWSKSQGTRRRKFSFGNRENPCWYLSRRLFGQYHFLLQKDIRSFYRDPMQLSQVLIFFGLLAIYFLNIRNLSYTVTGGNFWTNFVSFLNLAATALVLTTMATRFIFPLVSLEGKRFWIMGLLPVNRAAIVLSKFAFSFAGAMAITFTLILISSYMLKLPPIMIVMQLTTISFISLGLTGMSIGLGAAYPKFDEENPARIVSGFGGTLNLILSFLYVTAMVAMGAVPSHLYMVRGMFGDHHRQVFLGALLGMFTLTLMSTILPLAVGIRRFKRVEF